VGLVGVASVLLDGAVGVGNVTVVVEELLLESAATTPKYAGFCARFPSKRSAAPQPGYV
jgi:hypothetical protein